MQAIPLNTVPKGQLWQLVEILIYGKRKVWHLYSVGQGNPRKKIYVWQKDTILNIGDFIAC